MIDIRTKSTQLLDKLAQENLSSDDERPADPNWLRARFPKSYSELETNLHIMEWKDFLNHLCQEIQKELDNPGLSQDYINRDAQEIQLADHVQAKLPDGYDTCYFDTEAPLDGYSSFVTYDIINMRAQDYQGPKEVE